MYSLYLRSWGWRMTKFLRKRTACQVCGTTKRLELHHDEYQWHNRHSFLRWIVPNMRDKMRTLCRDHHEQVQAQMDKKKRNVTKWQKR